MSQYYRTKHVLMLIGSEANFEKAEYYFKSLERLITHFNNVHKDIQLSMSTLSYYDEMVSYHDEELNSYYFDMMPYSDENGRTYNGQFTSRPNLKTAIREAS